MRLQPAVQVGRVLRPLVAPEDVKSPRLIRLSQPELVQRVGHRDAIVGARALHPKGLQPARRRWLANHLEQRLGRSAARRREAERRRQRTPKRCERAHWQHDVRREPEARDVVVKQQRGVEADGYGGEQQQREPLASRPAAGGGCEPWQALILPLD